MKTEKQQAAAAVAFARRWQGRGYEKGDSQIFWADLLTNVFGVENIADFIRYEEQVKVDKTNFIDGHIPSTRVLIEQKSLGKDLRKGIPQSDGSVLNPFQQAKRYVANMPLSEHPRWIVTCNFEEFLVYDMEQPNGEPEQILLENLGKEYYRLMFLVDSRSEHITREMEVSMKAGEIVGRIYDALLKQYGDNSSEALRWLNILCVRIVFCLYAEDAGVFAHDQFHDFLAAYEAKDLQNALLRLFEVLNTPVAKRSKYLQEDLKAFPYTNGGLFEEVIEIPQFTEELKQTLLQNASLDFDWSEISPTIFGAVFESTLNPETRRSGGMHYTSIENIHKVIDPLFLNDLRRELDDILEEKVERQRQRRLDAYQDRLASLTFLDPACGSGNFLTETYLSLRRLENEVIRERYHGQMMMGDFLSPIKVSIHQFFGIEINDFAVTVATTALWISEAQMLAETERIIQHNIDFLPLKSYSNIKEGNALRMDWSTLEKDTKTPFVYTKKLNVFKVEDVPKEILDAPFMASEPSLEYGKVYDELNVVTQEIESKALPQKQVSKPVVYDYIIGNPPFVGARWMDKMQKDDVLYTFGKSWQGVGDLDYVCCWYKKAAEVISDTQTKVAFVSTNSITQGGAVTNLWKPLFQKQGIRIDFARRTFRWDSESTVKAHVYCVIVGFSNKDSEQRQKFIFDESGNKHFGGNINGYLLDAPNVWIENQSRPLCNVPIISMGNQPIDNGLYLFNDKEKSEFVSKEPSSLEYFRKWIGGEEFINNKHRWCLWLGDCTPAQLRKMPHCLERAKLVQEYRLSSKRASTIKLADRPTRFQTENMPGTNCIVIPEVSSEKRKYIPIGFIEPGVLCSNKLRLMPNATLFHFGVLTSNVHNAWMRSVCGRLETRYDYSIKIVYNNFPWPNPTDEQKAKIEQTAQAILDARALYPDSSLADLYDELTMPVELRKAHQDNDRAVMQAYGFDVKTMTESQCVAELFKMYQEMTK
mgnify:FL=1